jgi:hypothetical protein
MSDEQAENDKSINQTGASGDDPNGTSARVGTSGVESSVIGRPLQSPSYATLAGLVAAVTAGLAVLRYAWSWARPKPKTADEKLVEATQALGAAAVGLGSRAARRTASVAERTASLSEPVVREAASRAAVVAHDASSRAADVASVAASRAVDVASDAAELAVSGAKTVAAAAAEGAGEVADGVEAVQKAWSKLVTRLTILVFGSIGYVLGARAGRERYDQIVSVAKQAQGAVKG